MAGWYYCQYQLDNFVIAVVKQKYSQTFQTIFSLKIKLKWYKSAASAPFSSPSTPLLLNWPLTFLCVGDRCFISFCSSTGFLTAQPEMTGYEVRAQEMEIISAEHHMINWPFSLRSMAALLLCFEGATRILHTELTLLTVRDAGTGEQRLSIANY